MIELNSKLEKISFLSIDDPNYLANVTTLADGLQVALRDGYDTQEHLAVTLKHLAGAPGRSNTSESRKTPSTYHKGGCLYNHAEGASICFGRECKNGIKIGNFEKNIEDIVYNYRDLQMRGVDPGLPTEGRFNFSPEHYSIFSSHAGPLQDSYKEKVCPQVREVQKFKPIQRQQETQASLNSTHEGDATGKPTISALIPTNHAGIPFAITVSQIESTPHKYYFSKIEVLAQGKTEGEISEAIFEMLKKEAGQFDIEPIYSSQNSTAQGNQPCFLTSTGQPIPIYIHTGSKEKLAYFSNCIPYGGTKISFR